MLLLPPGSILLVLAIGLLLFSYKRISRLLIVVGIVSLYGLSIPAASYVLSGLVETYPVIDQQALLSAREHQQFEPYQAVIVLAGGVREQAQEFGGPTVGPVTLWRTRYGVMVSKSLALPLMMSGGTPANGGAATADLMAQVAQQEFITEVQWVESNSRTTWESAIAAQKLLQEYNVNRIILVTDAWHMQRSVASFEAAGFDVLAAPTLFFEWESKRPFWFGLLPNMGSLHYNNRVLHELIGLAWYRFRYF